MEQIIKIALAIIFGLSALAKFSGKTKDTFKKSGYGPAFMYATAFAEVLFAAGLFTQYDLWAVIGLLTIILGAIVTLIRQRVRPAKYGMAVLSFILLLSLMVVRIYPVLNGGETRAAKNHGRGSLFAYAVKSIAFGYNESMLSSSAVITVPMTTIIRHAYKSHVVIVRVEGHSLHKTHFFTKGIMAFIKRTEWPLVSGYWFLRICIKPGRK